MTRPDPFAEAIANFSFADPRLEPLQEAVVILSDLCRGFAFSAHSDDTGLLLRAQSTAGSVDFVFEDSDGAIDMHANHFDEDGLDCGVNYPTWDGPWLGSRPRWEPEAVAGLIIAELGMRAAV